MTKIPSSSSSPSHPFPVPARSSPFKHSMEPVRYNLRSRGRVVGGNRVLRNRPVLAVPSSRKPCRRRRNQRPKLCFDPSKRERESEERMEEVYRDYMKKHYRYPLLAMEDYNNRHADGVQYEVVKAAYNDRTRGFAKVGLLHVVHFHARPIGNPNSSDTKIFVARVHQTPDFVCHVSDCHMYPGTSVTYTLSVRCLKCNIKDIDAFYSLSEKLSEDLRNEDMILQIRNATMGNSQATGLDQPS